MSWSWKLGRVADIDIYVHATFFLLIGWIAFAYWVIGRSVDAAIAGVAFILALFVCIVLHELGHALTARRYGIRTRDITLLPIGGVARLEKMPEDPGQELRVALAGPAVNGIIAVVLYGWIQLAGGGGSAGDIGVLQGTFAERLMVANLWLGGFNLLPAFPMDGGRVLRALLATRMEYTRATQRAAAVGQAMALVFGFVGLLGNPFLLFIALFVWIGAAQEASMAQMKAALAGIPVQRAMLTDFRALQPTDTLQTAADLLLSGFQQDFPVVRDGRVEGMLTREDIVSSLKQRGPETLVADVMRPAIVVDAGEMLEEALARLQGENGRSLPVVHEGRLVGLLTTDNVGELLMLQAGQGDKARRVWHGRRRALQHR